MKWESVYKPKEHGGLGVKNRAGASQWWRDIVKLDEFRGEQWGWLNQQFKKSIGNGLSTKFWKQKWIDEGILKDMFARFLVWMKSKESLELELEESIVFLGGRTTSPA